MFDVFQIDGAHPFARVLELNRRTVPRTSDEESIRKLL
jgi:hypothetical protein